ncbi:MAG: NAD(P)-binding protein [Planctomycetota bacterium]
MSSSLPPHLAERTEWSRPLTEEVEVGQGRLDGRFVLYWMHNAFRAHENPALDVAIHLANERREPLLVYLGLSEEYPFASDRLHCFILQGIRDVLRELREREISGYFHLQADRRRGPHLKCLVERASVLVTGEMPVEPLVGWMERLQTRTRTPIAVVDTSCIVPSRIVQGDFNQPYQYREATQDLYDERIGKPYVECKETPRSFNPNLLPFEPIDLANEDLTTLIARCRVDHSIPPVMDSPGGSRAGYRRWEDFRSNRLEHYADQRNASEVIGGVSRLSAYLHFGMISPFRIAREAADAGAAKFLDQLLVWRELAYYFCRKHSDNLESISVLPCWAQETLKQHRGDQRKIQHRETLLRGLTGEPLWDLCQKSLIRHGELHNNLRMTWAKAIAEMTPTAEAAIRTTLNLNHRYSLDGRDPCSYLGVLWCYGLMDRPFEHDRPILGTVRPRCLAEQTEKADLKRLEKVVGRPTTDRPLRVAIVGAGMGGLIAARSLIDHGIDVEVFDKSRGVGGRLASRRFELNNNRVQTHPTSSETRTLDGGASSERLAEPAGTLALDHGAQYFTARDSRFCRFVDMWINEGLIEPWTGRVVEATRDGRIVEDKSHTPRYIATPTMNHLAKHLARDVKVHRSHHVAGLEPTSDDRWRIRLEGDARKNQSVFDQASPFDHVLFNSPPKQTAALLPRHASLHQQINSIQMRSTWAVMLASRETMPVDFDAAFINEGPISWIARHGSRPGRHRHAGDAWVIHASHDWSDANTGLSREEAKIPLLDAFVAITQMEPIDLIFADTHFWRYANPADVLPTDHLWDPALGIAVCGDWCGGPRVEGAFLSGMAAAGAIMRHHTIDRVSQPQELALR